MEPMNQPKAVIGNTMAETLQISSVITALAASATEVHEQGDYCHAIIPQGYKLEDISKAVEKMQPAPRRMSGTVQLKDLDSLLLYCADQNAPTSDAEPGASENGYIYADPDQRRITAVFNDNRDWAVPGWRDHRAEYKAEYTPEFSKWMERNKHQFDQSGFSEFIEDNMADITAPAATALLEMATTIQAKTDINFSSAKRLQNGQVQLQYTENIDARAGANGAMEIPKEFALGLRIFKNGGGYKVHARLKYRLHGGSIKFWYELDRVERVIEDAFSGYVATLREQSGYVVLLGTP
jgi:uncharacterized protein YfdQ (DUF2303 family)